ncbi:FKBP-type peptidyl-prolyl cis-trans isomerase [Georgenia sp. SYP-B2076]|uniref:FKBP-type peptidyl-prolyl cis-trans isomerase n=1 Tax=Georgenia sp. SYP-B2076 TaxID=2495881 RepID=UPI000F8E6510|nr:FKBP-type peptidyl-prolyl cis-trans isomerase [Georgenia sp. SYP-B2076]
MSELPTATGGFGDKPELTFPANAAPEGLQVQVLEQGDGDTVEAGSTIVVNYLGQTWGGHVFDNSYDRGATISFPIGMGVVIGGWDDGLVGQQIGSRVLLSIPPEHGYGPNGMPQAGIKGTDTLVFVVDVVGVE